jgi:hypothetical protein
VYGKVWKRKEPKKIILRRIYKMSTKFWWKNEGTKTYDDKSTYVDGWHHFCYDEEGNSEFYIQEVDICYSNWPEEKRRDHFGDTKYVWGGCSDGVGYSRNPLKADNIDDAKKEFEEWYKNKLIERVNILNSSINEAKNELAEFYLYLIENREDEKDDGVEDRILAIKETPTGIVELHEFDDYYYVLEKLSSEEIIGKIKYNFMTRPEAEKEVNEIIRRHMNI